MPKSKRNKQVELAKTKKHGLEGKKHLYNEVRSCIDSYTHLFIFSVNDMRNTKMKSVREQWKHSRFFIGKNKVMAIALGRSPEEEYRPNLHKIGEQLKGERGILFSNQPVEEVVKWFSSYSEGDYARSGNIATENVALSEGPLPQFPHNLESYLRQLGLPTTLQKGVVHLVKDHVVCNQGDSLTPETARILKLLGYEMAEFQINIECVWSQDGSFQHLKSDTYGTDGKENNMEKVHETSPVRKVNEISDPCTDGKENNIEKVHDASPVKKVDEISVEVITLEDEEVMEVEEDGEDKEEQFIENFLNESGSDVEETLGQPVDKEEQTDNNASQVGFVGEEEVDSNQMSEEIEQFEKGVNDERGSGTELTENEQVVENNIVNEDNGSDPKLEVPDKLSVLKLTEQKITNDRTPPKYSPKMTRARALEASVKKVKVPKEKKTVKEAIISVTDIKSPEEIARRTRAARSVNGKKT